MHKALLMTPIHHRELFDYAVNSEKSVYRSLKTTIHEVTPLQDSQLA